MLKQLYIVVLLGLMAAIVAMANNSDVIAWPPQPDPTRVLWLEEIKCNDLEPGSGFLGKLKRLVAGDDEADRPVLPFDIEVTDESIFMICQTLPALVEIDRLDHKYKLHRCSDKPIIYPIALCLVQNDLIFFTDSEGGRVYKFDGKKVQPLITSGLVRPTGIAVNRDLKKLYVIDTGDHTLKIYNYDGRLIQIVGSNAEGDSGFNFPTFATADHGGIWINDALNYRIKKFSSEGSFLTAFGQEGDGPGTLSRPKGIALDNDANIWVVDNIFDNVQLFNENGEVMLIIGSQGSNPGQFWSPSGIDIKNDTVFIADTFNNRIQVLHYLGDGK